MPLSFRLATILPPEPGNSKVSRSCVEKKKGGAGRVLVISFPPKEKKKRKKEKLTRTHKEKRKRKLFIRFFVCLFVRWLIHSFIRSFVRLGGKEILRSPPNPWSASFMVGTTTVSDHLRSPNLRSWLMKTFLTNAFAKVHLARIMGFHPSPSNMNVPVCSF